MVASSTAALEAVRLLLRDALADLWKACSSGTPPIEQAHRDIHAVLQHIVLQHFWLEQAGRIRLGLKPTHPLF
jgi:hypothetical protein